MNSVERVKALCKERKIPISRLERDLGFANGYISQLRKGVFPSDRLAKIADYLSVSTDYLLGGEDETKKTAILSDNGLVYLENSYLRLAQGAKELGLNDNDISAILALYEAHKQKNE